MTETCLVAVSIDVECDKDTNWRVRKPLAFRGVEDGVGERLAPLFAEYGVRPTYLLSPEVMGDAPSVALFKSLGDCELGTHLHSEFVGAAEQVDVTDAVACFMSEADERRALEQLTSAFATTFGAPPASYRAGRFGANARTIRLLDSLGYRVDSSVTPHKLWDFGLDFRGAPAEPYYPEPSDINRPSDPAARTGNVLEVPVSLRPSPAPGWVRAPAQLAARTRLRSAREFAKWARGPLWFRPGWSDQKGLLAFVRGASAGEYGRVLNMMFHNVDVVPGYSPNAPTGAVVETVLADLRRVFEETLSRGGRFATLSEIRESLDSRG